MYDAWEPNFQDIEKIIRKYNINLLFNTSMQSSTYFNSLNIKKFKSFWVPEGINICIYTNIKCSEREIDVLQFGRKWEWYHNKIKPFCENRNFNYIHEEKKGDIIFKSRDEFISGLANSKISICVPSNITDPKRSGYISTMTNRYLQSMASKCLILGKIPNDMRALFDYNPIIEIDDVQPVEQLEYILNNFDNYQDLINKNYSIIKAKHQWINRIEMIENCINEYESYY